MMTRPSPTLPSFEIFSKELAPADMLDAHSIQKALEGFRQNESELKALRDHWIYHYLREDPPEPKIQPEESDVEADTAHEAGLTSSRRFKGWLRGVVAKSG